MFHLDLKDPCIENNAITIDPLTHMLGKRIADPNGAELRTITASHTYLDSLNGVHADPLVCGPFTYSY